MKFIRINSNFSNAAPAHSERLSNADPYGSLAVNIVDALVDGRRLLLVASEPLPSSWLIREALETLEQQLHILEIPCGRRVASAEIIEKLSRFISVEIALGRLRGKGGGPSGSTLILCDNAEQLDAQQLRILLRLVERTGGNAAILLLATSNAFLQAAALQRAGIHNAVFVSLPFGQSTDAVASEIGETARTIIPVRDLSSAHLATNSAEGYLPQPKAPERESPPNWVVPDGAADMLPQVGSNVSKKLWYSLWLALLFCISFGLGGLVLHYVGVSRSGGKLGDFAFTQASGRTGSDRRDRPLVTQRTDKTWPAAVPPSSFGLNSSKHDLPPSASSLGAETGSASLRDENASNSVQAIAPSKSDESESVPSATPADAAAMLEQGEHSFAAGDITSARSYFEKAANAGNARAALRMGETFDPGLLSAARIRGNADVTQADLWYRRAEALAKAPRAALPQTGTRLSLDPAGRR